ncbi:uncharacterized protein LOC119616275 [Lucilia sericata]|uniref:uncharacterized protein LOC119616275 n=1 Tax=Lucilia sericata TaxID=13632 RepID=UPI0018A83E8E|nr:uncharacterized protein LOC119616275 [Lucilia sericata]
MLTAHSVELPNPHKKCIRELLNYLTCFDNDYQSINIELRNIQKEFKQSIDNVVFHCSELRKLACASDERLDEFQRNVENIDAITESFNKRIENLQKKREEIIEESKKCFEQLQVEKMRLKHFHQKTINHLKSFAVQANDAEIIKNCEKDLNEINKQFAKELSYIRKCESVLDPFFRLLRVCKSQVCHLNEYEWVPQGKSTEIVDSIAKEIRDSMGTTLRCAFAHLHIHQPNDTNSCLAQYLMALVHNEEMMGEKLELFTAN